MGLVWEPNNLGVQEGSLHLASEPTERRLCHVEVSKKKGPLFGSPHNKCRKYLGLCWGPLFLEALMLVRFIHRVGLALLKEARTKQLAHPGSA